MSCTSEKSHCMYGTKRKDVTLEEPVTSVLSRFFRCSVYVIDLKTFSFLRSSDRIEHNSN